ncbi:hypothetical protein QE382_002487 [Sphingobacterium zeae]|uniref:Uncharacterized protein n=2 Tax=Sphingobacterium zeae TaxID=1776859 RepID=A0ABU0U6C8_9SPHI|nr:hypothetical protein [Sphingobacterium zeae]MDQ1150503.1 hypothetical protein [Sphingobacterium zeae]
MESISSVANVNDVDIMTQDDINDANEFKKNKEKFKVSDIDDEIFLNELKSPLRK